LLDHVPEWPFALDEAAEVSFLWMAQEAGRTTRRSTYAQLLTDLLATGKKIVLGGAVDPAIAQQQRVMLPMLLFRGKVPAFGPHRTLELYYGTLTTVFAGAFASGVPAPWPAFR
jgi:hypothetical protein